MSADGSVDLVFGGDTRHFRLAIENLIALQERCNAGPMAIVVGLQLGSWRLEHVTETIRIGLIGGGMDDKAARRLTDDNVRPGNIVPHVLTALAVLLSALQGDPDDPVGKKKGKGRRAPKVTGSPPLDTTAPAP